MDIGQFTQGLGWRHHRNGVPQPLQLLAISRDQYAPSVLGNSRVDRIGPAEVIARSQSGRLIRHGVIEG